MKKAFFANSKGQQLQTRHWEPRLPSGAAILILHGYAEYSGRYKETASFFNEHGVDVFAIDHHGHGESYGKKGLVNSWELLVDDAEEFLAHLQKSYPEITTWFLLGHSMGGAISVLLAERRGDTLGGIILSAPLIDENTSTPGLIVALGKLVARFMPSLAVIKFEHDAQCRDSDVMKQFLSDPNNYNGRLRAGTGNQLLNMIEAVDTVPEKIRVPCWIGHSSIDRLTSFEASRAFYQRLGSEDKTFRKYDGLFHELLNEPEKRLVHQEIMQWIKKRV